MPKPNVGISGDQETVTQWGVWYDLADLKDCYVGSMPDKERLLALAGKVWGESAGFGYPDPINVRLVSTVTRIDSSTVVTELDSTDIEYAKYLDQKAREANNG